MISRGRAHLCGEIVRVVGGRKRVLARLAVASNIEPGLVGIATNKKGYVWASYTTSEAGCPDPTRGKSTFYVNAICVWRLKPSGDKLKADKLIVSTTPNRSQDLTEPFGKILRIDPNRTNKAAAGNPKTCGDADNGTQRKIVGDQCDEINLVKPGVNFGWQPPAARVVTSFLDFSGIV